MATETPPVSLTAAEEQERQNRELIAAMIGQADVAPEPGTLRPRDVLHRGDEEVPPPIVASTLKSAGYRFIYDTRTGERSLTNLNMLPSQLRKVRQDGTPVFTIRRPLAEPVRGTLKCLLHADNPERRRWDESGFSQCHKDNLVSTFQVERHMRNRHRQEWESIQKMRQEERDKARWALEQVVLERAAQKEKEPTPREVKEMAKGPAPSVARGQPAPSKVE